MAITGQIVVPRIAQWCAIHLADERDTPVLQQVWHEDEQQVEHLRERRSRPSARRPAGGLGTAIVLGYVAPPASRWWPAGRRIGYLTIGRPAESSLRSEFFLVAESIARRAALAIDNARAHGALQADRPGAPEEPAARRPCPRSPGLDVGVVYEAAGEDDRGRRGLLRPVPGRQRDVVLRVGDVCGTGAEAAAVTGLARHTIRGADARRASRSPRRSSG